LGLRSHARVARGVIGSLLGSLVIGLALLSACGNPPPVELPDPASGQFLTLEQQGRLSREQLGQYCRMLDDYLATLHSDLELAKQLSDSLVTVVDSLDTVQSEVSRATKRLNADISRLRQGRTGSIEYVTREGDTLMKLAGIFYDSNAEWRRIYNANQDQIQDAGAPLPPGLKLTIPQ
jgi:nucleoid-associated protein YgaU